MQSFPKFIKTHLRIMCCCLLFLRLLLFTGARYPVWFAREGLKNTRPTSSVGLAVCWIRKFISSQDAGIFDCKMMLWPVLSICVLHSEVSFFCTRNEKYSSSVEFSHVPVPVSLPSSLPRSHVRSYICSKAHVANHVPNLRKVLTLEWQTGQEKWISRLVTTINGEKTFKEQNFPRPAGKNGLTKKREMWELTGPDGSNKQRNLTPWAALTLCAFHFPSNPPTILSHP